MKSGKIFIALILAAFLCRAQEKYPQDYLMFPIKPGQVNYLSGNMGELRPNHFHGGLDIKTEGRTGLSVYCSADGYVSRIKISTSGYGNVLYVTHPNGLTTVYAHLEKFKKAIGDFARQKQYEKESFEIDINIDKEALPVKKGEVIGLSGNSGGSGGPHLHYEIRDENEHVLNPLLFGFKEITDKLPPLIEKIAFRTLDINSRINGEFGRIEFKPSKPGDIYQIPAKIMAFGSIGIELKAFDKMDGTSNVYGVKEIMVLADGIEIFHHNMETFSFDESRYINIHLDYETLLTKGQRFQRCYIQDGDGLRTYKNILGRGRLYFTDTTSRNIEVIAVDAHGNKSVLRFRINGTKPGRNTSSPAPAGLLPGYEISENTLKIKAKSSRDLKIFLKGDTSELPLSYSQPGQSVFLYDLRAGLPDSLEADGKMIRFNFITPVYPGKSGSVQHKNLNIQFPPNALFDTLYLQASTDISKTEKETFQAGDPLVPLFSGINLSYLPINSENINISKAYPFLLTSYKGQQYETGKWEEGQLTFKTKSFGTFIIREDSIPPEIKYLGVSGNTIKFNIFDKDSGINTFRATLNGEWLLMNYDHKQNLIWSERYDKTVPLKGNFKLEVTDKTGNINTYTLNLP